MPEGSEMRCDEYHRLHAACLIMAEQSKQPDERARWFTLAQDCLVREAEDHWKLA